METPVTESQTLREASAYAKLHMADWIPANYDNGIYDPAGYDAWVWSLYGPSVIRIVEQIASQHEAVKYLDFACGTGRILATLEHLTDESVGLDISPHMADFARTKVSRSTIRCGDILSNPNIVDDDYDLITAFRFFLNTESDMREGVMHSLAGRLADTSSRLIFNVHMNRWSVDGLKSAYRRLRWHTGPVRTMSFPEVLRLVTNAGLEIEAWYGFGLWPYRLYRSRLGAMCRRVDRWAAGIRPLRWVSHDMLFVCRRPAGARPSRDS